MNTDAGNHHRATSADRPLLIGCGIFRKEIDFLCRQRQWSLDTDFLPPSLHIDLKALHGQLSTQLHRHGDRRPAVLYGCCHPAMDKLLSDAGSIRTEGQNCIELLLGKALFDAELAAGAFFLLEAWAHEWTGVIERTFGRKWDITRAIFHEDRRYMLAIRTPASGDFTAAAIAAAASVDLPLRWLDVDLDHLEAALLKVLGQRRQARAQQQ